MVRSLFYFLQDLAENFCNSIIVLIVPAVDQVLEVIDALETGGTQFGIDLTEDVIRSLLRVGDVLIEVLDIFIN